MLGVCLGSLQLARVRVPAILSGDDERKGRRESPVRERQLSGNEACHKLVFCSHFLKLSAVRKHRIKIVLEYFIAYVGYCPPS